MMSYRADQRTNPKPQYPALILCFAALASIMLIGCGKSSDTAKTPELQPKPISMPSLPTVAQSTPTPAPPKQITQPTTEEVNDVVVRVFNKAVTVDSNYTPAVLVGDFNGDGSEDIAIAMN